MLLRVLVGVVLLALLGVALWVFIKPEDPTQRKDFAQLLAQIVGGGALLFGLYFTWRRVEISQRTLETQQDQQVTERFTRAIDQLGATDDKGNPRLEIRLGGIYALERIAKDSPERYYSTAYVRQNAPWSPKGTSDPTTTPKDEATEQKEDDKQAEANTLEEQQHTPSELRADIRAIVDVLRRREEHRLPEERRVPLDLQKTNLSGANLNGVYLRGVNLRSANLYKAHLFGANLYEVDLSEAVLNGAILRATTLSRANLRGGYLLLADLHAADLQEANLSKAILHEGDLPRGADLSEALL